MKANCRVKPYAYDRLKWVVRGKENGTWIRKFFEKKVEAETYAQIKNTELLNQGMEGVSFPAALRVMALECEKRLAEFGKTLRDATDFYIPHLQRSQKAVALRGVVDEVLSAKAAKGIKATTLKVYGHRVKQFAADFPNRSINGITRTRSKNGSSPNFPTPSRATTTGACSSICSTSPRRRNTWRSTPCWKLKPPANDPARLAFCARSRLQSF